MRTALWLVSALCSLAPRYAAPQAPPPPAAEIPPVDSLVRIWVRLTDGTDLAGRVVARDDTSFTLLTPTGLRILVPARAVGGWRVDERPTADRRLWPRDPNSSRLFFAATGRTLNQGEGYFADYFLFFPFVAFGFHDRFMMAGGASLVPGLDLDEQLLYLAPKLGLVQSPTVNVAVGGILATIPDEGGVGAAYAVGTLGGADHSATLLIGYPFVEGEDPGKPGFVLGGETRVSRSVKLLFELWEIPDARESPLVGGIRIFGERLAVDFGLMHVVGADLEGLPFIPWVDFVVNWRGGRPGSTAAPLRRLTDRDRSPHHLLAGRGR